jgi:hypothetical protein
METINHLGNFDVIAAASLAEVDVLGNQIISDEYRLLRDPSSKLVRTLGQLGNTEVTFGPVPDKPKEPQPTPPRPPEQPKPDPMP